ncbi:MAG: hypothetical protein IJ740_00160 [Ruminococcus sp.]|nr:hypothetical protein [Ruminococcus sp.]
MADEKKLPEEELENLEVDLDEVADVSGGQGPIIHGTGDITPSEKKRS